MNETTVLTDAPDTRVANTSTRSFCPNTPPTDDARRMHFWYPMYVSYRRELSVQKVLEANDFKTFIPMVSRARRIDKKIVQERVAAIHNLLFVYSYKERIRWMKMFNRECGALQYISVPASGTMGGTEVMTIPARQMENFIHAATASEDNPHALYLDPQHPGAILGKQVEFAVGPFKGVQGYVKRVNKNRMLIVMLQGIASIALPIEHVVDLKPLDE